MNLAVGYQRSSLPPGGTPWRNISIIKMPILDKIRDLDVSVKSTEKTHQIHDS